MMHVRRRNSRRQPPDSQQSVRTRSHSPPVIRARTKNSGMSRILSPSAPSRATSLISSSSRNLGPLNLPDMAKGDETMGQRSRGTEYEEPQLQQRTIQMLQKQLDASKDNAERWKRLSFGDDRMDSQYRREIVAMQQQLEEQEELIQEQDLAIENLTSHLQNPPSQNTSVCSSFLEEIDSAQSQEMERLLKENSVYAHRLLEQDDDLDNLRRQKATVEQERAALGKKVAALTMQQLSEQKESDILRKESALLESQVSALQAELAERKQTSKVSVERSSFGDVSDQQDPPSLSSPRDGSQNDESLLPSRGSMKNTKRIIELQNEARKLTRDLDSSQEELKQTRHQRDSIRTELEQTRKELWKAKVLTENMEDMVHGHDHTNLAFPVSRRLGENAANDPKNKLRDMNRTIVRLQSEIRKRDAAIADLEKANEKETETARFLSVQRETRKLKAELDTALVDLEKASVDQTELRKKINGLESLSRAKDNDIVRFKRDMEARTETLEELRSVVAEKDRTINEMKNAHMDAIAESCNRLESLQKQLRVANNENEMLRNQGVTTEIYEQLVQKTGEQEQIISSLEQTMIEKDILIDELNVDCEIARRNAVEKAGNWDSKRTSKYICQDRALGIKSLDSDSFDGTRDDLHRSDGINAKTHKTNHQLKQALESQKRECESMQSQLDGKEMSVHEVEKAIESINRDKKEVLEQSKAAGEDKDLLVSKLTLSTEEVEALRRDIESEKVNLERVQSECIEKDEEIDLLKRSKADLLKSLNESNDAQANLQIKCSQLQSLLKQKENDVEGLHRDLESHNRITEQIRDDLDSRDKKIVALVSSQKQLVLTLENSREECESMRSATDAFEKDLRARDSKIQLLEKHLDDVNQIKTQKEQQIADLLKSKHLLSCSLEKASTNLSIMVTESASARQVLQQRNDEAERMIDNISCQNQDFEKLGEQLEQKDARIAELLSSFEHCKFSLDDSVCARGVLEERVKENINIIDSIQTEKDNLSTELQNRTAEIIELHDELESCNSRLSELLKLESSLEKEASGECFQKNMNRSVAKKLGNKTINEARDVAMPDESVERTLNNRKEDSIQDIRKLIDEGLRSVRQLEQVKVKASAETENLRSKISNVSKEVVDLKEKLELSQGEVLALKGQLEHSVEHSKALQDTNIEAAAHALKLRQTISASTAENARLTAELEARLVEAVTLEEQTNKVKKANDLLLAENDALKITISEKTTEHGSLVSKYSSLEENLQMSREEVFSISEKKLALQRQVAVKDEQIERLQKDLQNRSAILDKVSSELTEEKKLLEKIMLELSEKEIMNKDLKASLEEAKIKLAEGNQLKIKLENRAIELEPVLDDNKRLKGDTERKKADLKALSEESEHLKINFLRQYDELKALSTEKDYLQIELKKSEQLLCRAQLELEEAIEEAAVDAKTKLKEALELASTEKKARDLVEEEKIQVEEELHTVKTQLSSLHRESEDLKSKLNAEKENVSIMNGSLHEKKNRIEELSTEIEKRNLAFVECEKMKAANEELSTALAEKSAEMIKIEGEVDRYQSALAEKDVLKSHVEQKSKEIQELKYELQRRQEDLVSLQNVVEVSEGCQMCSESQKLRDENASLTSRVEETTAELAKLDHEIAKLKEAAKGNDSLDSLREKMEDMKRSGNETIQAYERQICALTMNKDVTIDTLRKDLAAARSRSAEEVARLTNQLSELQEENSALENQCNDESVRMRDQRIYALEHTLFAQEKTVDSLRSELDQLQLSMFNAVEQRRSDLEDLQREYMDSQSKLQKQERECSALKEQLGDSKMRYDTDIAELNDEIDRLRDSSSNKKSTRELRQTNMMAEVKSRLEQLKGTNVELKEQNKKLACRLEKASEKVKTIELEKDAAAEMEEECADLRRQVKELEHLLENSSGGTSKSESIAISKASEVSANSEVKMAAKESRGLGLGIGRRSKGSGVKAKIPSVLFIGKSKESSHGRFEQQEKTGM